MVRAEEAFYAKHADDMKWFAVLKRTLAAGLALTALWTISDLYAHEPAPGKASPAVTCPGVGTNETTFVDGPTGFVFVYTPDGWKFVPGIASAKP